MLRRFFLMGVLLICLGSLLPGCPKKAVVREDLASRRAEEKKAAEEKERADKLEAERAEMKAKELAKLKEEEDKKVLVEKALKAERERAAKLEAERAAREKERIAEEEKIRKALAEKELEAERERVARLEAERALREKEQRAEEEEIRKALAKKNEEFERSLVAKKYPGVEGEVFESDQLKNVYFDYDKFDIRPEDKEILKESAALLTRHPSVKIQIEGHCDARGTREYNLALGERRASSAKQYLVSLGVTDNRISTISFGAEMPVDRGQTEEAYAKNRRAHFVILSK